ncbi:MAG: hypothetical protein ACLP1X_10605 [Polyangiaceae bacterium]
MLVFASGACGALEGLDHYDACQTDCDASISQVVPPGDDAREETPEALPDTGEVADSSGDGGASPEAESMAEGGVVEGGGADVASGPCVCVDTAATGWNGYVKLLLASGSAPACVAPYGMALSPLKTAPAGAAPQCATCACAPPSSGPITCQVELGSGGLACAGETMTAAAQGACVIPPGPMGITSGPNGDSYGPTPTPTPSGNCAPDGGLAQPLGAATWTSVGVCAAASGATSGACATSGQTCVPVPQGETASASGVCIFQSGVATCPSGSYSQRTVASDAIVDTRGCACACAPPACPAEGYVQGFASLNCTGPVATTFDASTACALGDNANDSISFKYFPSHSTWSGTCAVSASGPDGGVALDNGHATTFCCVP